jgi:hypothetical protein
MKSRCTLRRPSIALLVKERFGQTDMAGNGHRVSPELKHKIMAALKAGMKPADLEREFSVCFNFIARLRRLLGSMGDRRHWRKLSPRVLAEAEERLRAGHKWREVAGSLGVSPTTLATHVRFRKRQK